MGSECCTKQIEQKEETAKDNSRLETKTAKPQIKGRTARPLGDKSPAEFCVLRKIKKLDRESGSKLVPYCPEQLDANSTVAQCVPIVKAGTGNLQMLRVNNVLDFKTNSASMKVMRRSVRNVTEKEMAWSAVNIEVQNVGKSENGGMRFSACSTDRMEQIEVKERDILMPPKRQHPI